MTTDNHQVVDPEEAILLGELEFIRAELVDRRRELDDIKVAHAQAVIDEGAAMDAVNDVRAAADPVIAATRTQSTLGHFVGDVTWKIHFPEAGAAFDQVQTAEEAVRVARVRTNKLRQAWSELEHNGLPRLEGMVSAAEQKLAEHRAARAAAMEQVKSESWKDGLRRRVLGQP